MSDIIRAFDLVAGTYDDWYDHPQGRQVFDAELNAVGLHIPKEGIGLELGAGTGIFAEHLTGAGRIIVCARAKFVPLFNIRQVKEIYLRERNLRKTD